MAKIRRKRKKRHIIRNLPLKWSFMLYVLFYVFLALTLSLTVSSWISDLQGDLYYKYEALYLQENDIPEDLLVNGSLVLDEDFISLYANYYTDVRLSPEDQELYSFYSALSFFSIPIVCLFCLVLAGFTFYNRKIKKPLQILDQASARIAAGDLDFEVVYDNRNEMGRLAGSFESMRTALQANHQEMWRMMEARKRLNAAFAHDLRTPLTVLKGYVEYLRTYIPQKRISEEKLLSTIGMMGDYVVRLEGYTISMSAMQKLEEITLNPAAVEFSVLCERLRGAAEMLRGPHQLQYACGGGGALFVDADIMIQVLENLVSNASRYAAKQIRVTIAQEGPAVRMTVSDDGPGFSVSVLRKGIAPYNRDKTEDANANTHFGLGLYICSVLCQKHEGELILPEEGKSDITAVFRQLTDS